MPQLSMENEPVGSTHGVSFRQDSSDSTDAQAAHQTYEGVSLQLVGTYLRVTENWMYRRFASLKRYRPLVLAHALENQAEYSLEHVGLHGRHPRWRRALNRTTAWPLYLWSAYASELGSFKPIILHSHFATVAVGHRNLRRLARDRYDCPTVCSFYGYDLKGLIPGQRWEGFDDLLREEVAFIVQGPRMAEHMAELGVDAAKLHLNPLGIDLSLFPQRTTKYVDGTLRVLTIGRFVEKKGIDDAIRAVSLAHRRGLKIHLTVVGDGPLRSSIEDVIAVEKAGESVTLMGAVEYELLRRAYYEHDVCLQPSVTAADGDTEGGANMCIIEAMAAGLPIVATRHADTETTVSEGVNAFLADERRPDQLATALCDLARDPDLWNDFSIAGRSRACLLFDANRQAVDLERTYDRIRRAWSGA